MKDVEGDRPVEYAGQEVSLVSEAQRYPCGGLQRDRQAKGPI